MISNQLGLLVLAETEFHAAIITALYLPGETQARRAKRENDPRSFREFYWA